MTSSSPPADRTLCERHGGLARVNASHDSADRELGKTLERIDDPELRDGRDGLRRFVTELARCRRRSGGQVLDLIAHSTPVKYLLDFDGWRIGEDAGLVTAFCAAVRPSIQRFTMLRLIGCGTATTSAGRAAMAALQRGLGIPVQGTTSIVHRGDFGPDGFTGDKLVGPDGTHRLSFAGPPSTRVRRRFVPGELARVAARELPATGRPRLVHPYRDLERNAGDWIVDDRTRLLPGLLVRPRLEITFPVGRTGAVVFAEVLFRWVYLRVYPAGFLDGLLFKIAPALREALEAIPGNRTALRNAGHDA